MSNVIQALDSLTGAIQVIIPSFLIMVIAAVISKSLHHVWERAEHWGWWIIGCCFVVLVMYYAWDWLMYDPRNYLMNGIRLTKDDLWLKTELAFFSGLVGMLFGLVGYSAAINSNRWH